MASSRSHSIFTVMLEQTNLKDGSTKRSRLNLVDLAGSEKVRKTGATGQSLEEAKSINKSLSALSKLIFILSEGKAGVFMILSDWPRHLIFHTEIRSSHEFFKSYFHAKV
jgi:hypothetical protein